MQHLAVLQEGAIILWNVLHKDPSTFGSVSIMIFPVVPCSKACSKIVSMKVAPEVTALELAAAMAEQPEAFNMSRC